MHGVNWIMAIIIGIFAGWLAEKIMKRDHGLLTNLVVGLVGSLLGAFVMGIIGFRFGGLLASLVVSTLGAVLLLWLWSLIKRD